MDASQRTLVHLGPVSQELPHHQRILLVDDDRELKELLHDYLTPLGYEVHAAYTGPDGVQRATSEEWHAVILDVMMPGLDGFDAPKAIRKTSTVPVLMLTSRGDEMDRIVGLEVGADDYLPKTFSTRELLARLRAVTRRASMVPDNAPSAAGEPEVVVGPVRVNPNTRVALLHDQPLVLTPVEFEFLHSLAKSKGRVKSREQLLDEIRDREWEVFDRSVDVHIAALRRKLGDDARQPRFIRTLRSAGYMFIDPERP
ncbi:MAG: response regulator transcription factor [Roseimicrobium sp.]